MLPPKRDVTAQRAQFVDADLIVTLDGYAPKRSIGYSFISHSDVDVVTDFDEGAEVAFEQLARDSQSLVLIIHDTDMPNTDALERRIDAYSDQLNAWHQET